MMELQPEENSNTPTLAFSTISNFFGFFDRSDDVSVIFKHVSLESFSKIEAGRQRRGRKLRFHYRPEEHLLFVSVPRFEHDTASWTLSHAIYDDLRNMGLSYNDLTSSGATTYGDGGSGKGCGEPDASFMPPGRSDNPHSWPTLVVETGLSQSWASLQAKMSWWFGVSNHEVKIVLLLGLDRASRTICVKKYVKDTTQTRQGATMSRNMSRLVPQLRQTITITMVPGSQPAVYDVVGGPLVLEFALLFLRPADSTRGERDIILDDGALSGLARQVWQRTTSG